MTKKTEVQELREELAWSFPHVAKDASKQVKKAFGYCEGCKAFLDGGKTERECVEAGIRVLKKTDYRPSNRKVSYEPGDRVYYVSRGKALIAATFDKEPLTEGIRINGAHVNPPHLDLKPNPLYKRGEIAYFRTHYYDGIRKYRWGTVPLATHGTMAKENDETIKVCIGEEESDPVLCVTDLSPRLPAEQSERPLKDGLKGEELNVVVGSLPFQGEKIKEPFELLALSLLNERYDITEKDLSRAELKLIPAVKARDVGLDANMIRAYRRDDRVHAYTALTAEIGAKKSAHTTITILTDEEETGLDDNIGLGSDYVPHYIENLAGQVGVKVRNILHNSPCLSSDIDAVYNPTFFDVHKGRNPNYVNKGCILTRYTGAKGRSDSSDASVEVMVKVISMMEQEGAYWQTGELGAVGAGGGGTIVKFITRMNADTVGLGVPILSIHSPFELASKSDVYNTYKASRAFYEQQP